MFSVKKNDRKDRNDKQIKIEIHYGSGQYKR
jgi:hypothetical protein